VDLISKYRIVSTRLLPGKNLNLIGSNVSVFRHNSCLAFSIKRPIIEVRKRVFLEAQHK
jgi:hypothetical protein